MTSLPGHAPLESKVMKPMSLKPKPENRDND